jgi:hypothetical protein
MADSLEIPYGDEIHALDVANGVEEAQLLRMLDNSEGGVSICVRHNQGDPDRGGYFFHIRKMDDNFLFKTFKDREAWIAEDIKEAIRFVNHVCGFEYDEEMWKVSQKVNLIEESSGDVSF